jgi:crotonobetainyl-CoA:carnitine CoA-transferase CaiB-like acyl-CoA transferase
MFEAVTHMVLGDHMGGLTFDPPIAPSGYDRLLVPHRHPYRTKDGHICAVIYTNAHWKAFLGLIGQDEIYQRDPRFSDLQERTKHIGELYAFVSEQMRNRSSAGWLELLTAADIPAAAMHTPETLLDDPHLKAVNFFQRARHPTDGDIVQMRYPCRMSGMPTQSLSFAPRLGADSRAILSEVGYEEEEIRFLLSRGSVGEQTHAPLAELPVT